ncbi:MAG: cbb3-type cytochrome oxidase assembly protein CcoS [Verrucomicrobia bacterium]|nr:cbb3-type cytochrome oxidase assembly protein CcoS [Verrucomicrobiota bacterium]
MTVVWILFVCSVVLLPGTALLALRWAARHGEFNDLQRTALSIFDEDEPIGVMSDHFPGRTRQKSTPPGQARGPSGLI